MINIWFFGVGKWADELNFIDFRARKWTVIDFGVGKWADELTSVNKINFADFFIDFKYI